MTRRSKSSGKSHHAKATQFTGSLDNFLGNVVEGPEVVTTGCAGCHGSVVKVLGKLHPARWPNSGTGRVILMIERHLRHLPHERDHDTGSDA